MMPVITTGPVKSALVDENGQLAVTVKISNSGKKPRAVLIKGYSSKEIQNPAITQVVNIQPKSEIIRNFSGTTDAFQFNFQVMDFTGLKISVWRNNGTINEQLPLFRIG